MQPMVWLCPAMNGCFTFILQCQPYFDAEGCGHPGCSPVYPTPRCFKSCIDDELWGTSKHYAQSAYLVGPNQEEIKTELYLNGPLEVDFTVFEVCQVFSTPPFSRLLSRLLVQMLCCQRCSTNRLKSKAGCRVHTGTQ